MKTMKIPTIYNLRHWIIDRLHTKKERVDRFNQLADYEGMIKCLEEDLRHADIWREEAEARLGILEEAVEEAEATMKNMLLESDRRFQLALGLRVKLKDAEAHLASAKDEIVRKEEYIQKLKERINVLSDTLFGRPFQPPTEKPKPRKTKKSKKQTRTKV